MVSNSGWRSAGCGGCSEPSPLAEKICDQYARWVEEISAGSVVMVLSNLRASYIGGLLLFESGRLRKNEDYRSASKKCLSNALAFFCFAARNRSWRHCSRAIRAALMFAWVGLLTAQLCACRHTRRLCSVDWSSWYFAEKCSSFVPGNGGVNRVDADLSAVNGSCDGSVSR